MSATLEQIISLAKRRGFVYPSSEIYGGLANAYDYGPLGAELLRNIKNLWWEHFVTRRPEIIGLDTSILMSPKVWEASGHTQGFADVLVDCKNCNFRTRADHLIEKHLAKNSQAEGLSPKELTELIYKHKIPCPNCKKFNWTEARKFNLLFETKIGILPEKQALAYLRGEIAQGMFVNFKNVLDSYRINSLPFGLAQSGKAFRNEITKGNFIFRTLEFNLAEIEYFFNPQKSDWKKLFSSWKRETENWAELIGLNKSKLCWRRHSDKERAHYSTHTEDLDYQFPFGFKELYGLAYRTDFDLRNHMEKSGADLRFTEPGSEEKFIPHTIEPTFGLDRTFLALLTEAYLQEPDRIVLKLKPCLAPFKVAVFPLLSNQPKLVQKAKTIFNELLACFPVLWDARGNIGKRYFAQDEIGTPWCITIDHQTLEDNTVTIRDRDTKKQKRAAVNELAEKIARLLRDS